MPISVCVRACACGFGPDAPIRDARRTLARFVLDFIKHTRTHARTHAYARAGVRAHTHTHRRSWDFWEPPASAGGLVEAELRRYDTAAAGAAADPFGKTYFPGTPILSPSGDGGDGGGPFYAGVVSPAVHYCMGGIRIDSDGRALGPDGRAVPGLYAAGESAGGVHGRGRLAGNSLAECLVGEGGGGEGGLRCSRG